MVTVGTGATFDLNNYNDKVKSLVLSGGAVTTGTGTLILGGNITSKADIVTATIAGNLNLSDRICIVTVEDGSANPDLIISAAISHGTLSKTGPGTLA